MLPAGPGKLPVIKTGRMDILALRTFGPHLDVANKPACNGPLNAFVHQKLKVPIIVRLIETETISQHRVAGFGDFVFQFSIFASRSLPFRVIAHSRVELSRDYHKTPRTTGRGHAIWLCRTIYRVGRRFRL